MKAIGKSLFRNFSEKIIDYLFLRRHAIAISTCKGFKIKGLNFRKSSGLENKT
jgi:hypothetical protein